MNHIIKKGDIVSCFVAAGMNQVKGKVLEVPATKFEPWIIEEPKGNVVAYVYPLAVTLMKESSPMPQEDISILSSAIETLEKFGDDESAEGLKNILNFYYKN